MAQEESEIGVGLVGGVWLPSDDRISSGSQVQFDIRFPLDRLWIGEVGIGFHRGGCSGIVKPYKPGWTLVGVKSTVYVVPVVLRLIRRFPLSGSQWIPFVGGGATWNIVQERQEAYFLGGGWAMTSWDTYQGGTPGAEIIAGVVWIVSPRFAWMVRTGWGWSECTLGSEDFEVEAGGIRLSAGVQF
jgi:hypothetical protein